MNFWFKLVGRYVKIHLTLFFIATRQNVPKKLTQRILSHFFLKFKLNIDQKLNLHIETTNKTTWIENKNEVYWKTMENIKLVINTIKAGCAHLDLSYIIWYYFIARISIEKCSSDFDTFMKIWLKKWSAILIESDSIWDDSLIIMRHGCHFDDFCLYYDFSVEIFSVANF